MRHNIRACSGESSWGDLGLNFFVEVHVSLEGASLFSKTFCSLAIRRP